MSIKFTDPKKWDDVWFSRLSLEQKVMFIYLCDACDIAGFLEINERITTLRTGIEDVRGTIESLSKSIIFKDDYIWIIKHLKHQRNLPIVPKNNAHKAIIKSFEEHLSRFPEIFDYLSITDGETIREHLAINASPLTPLTPLSPTSKGISNSNSNSNTVTINTLQSESLIARLYKYFVGEENLMVEGITTGTRRILAEAIHVMDVEEWKCYCESRLTDKYKPAPKKFFLEDGWRKYQDDVRSENKKAKQADAMSREAKERRSLPQEEAPEEFKEFVKNFGKRSSKVKIIPHTTS